MMRVPGEWLDEWGGGVTKKCSETGKLSPNQNYESKNLLRLPHPPSELPAHLLVRDRLPDASPVSCPAMGI
jgi:hypothetical protein